MTTWITAVLLFLRNASGFGPVHGRGANHAIVPGTIANPAAKVQGPLRHMISHNSRLSMIEQRVA